MVDKTNLSQLNIQYDFWNGLYFLLMGISGAAMGLYGLNSGDFKLLGAGLTMTAVLFVAFALLRDNLLKSPASPFQASVAYWGMKVFAVVPLVFTEGTFSFYAPPSESYFSTAISDAPQWLKTFLDGHIAPYVENAAIFGEIILILGILEGTGGVNNIPVVEFPRPVSFVIHFFIAIIVGSVTFLILHGESRLQFAIRAIILMAFMAGILIAEDRGLISIPIFPVTFSAMYGLHSGININQHGGMIEYYSTIGEATGNVRYLIQGVYILDALTLIIALYGLARLAYNILQKL